MNTELNIKINGILENIDTIISSSILKKRFYLLQEEILNDEEFIEKQKRLLSLEINPYDSAYIKLKEELNSIPKVIEYIELENELLNFNLEVNNLLKDLLPERKGCK